MAGNGRISIVVRDFREDERHHIEIEKPGRFDYSIGGGEFQPGVTKKMGNLFSRAGSYHVQPACVDPDDAQQFRELLEQCQREGLDINIAETRYVSRRNDDYRKHV